MNFVLFAGRPWYEQFLIIFAKKVKLGSLLNLTKQYKKMEQALMKYSDTKSKVYLCYCGDKFNRMIIDKNCYGSGRPYLFRNVELIGPDDADAYLTIWYGDYMKLPPEDKRNKHSTELVD